MKCLVYIKRKKFKQLLRNIVTLQKLVGFLKIDFITFKGLKERRVSVYQASHHNFTILSNMSKELIWATVQNKNSIL